MTKQSKDLYKHGTVTYISEPVLTEALQLVHVYELCYCVSYIYATVNWIIQIIKDCDSPWCNCYSTSELNPPPIPVGNIHTLPVDEIMLNLPCTNKKGNFMQCLFTFGGIPGYPLGGEETCERAKWGPLFVSSAVAGRHIGILLSGGGVGGGGR
jgi:hypothetical protein